MAVAPLTGKALEAVNLAQSRLNIFEGSVRSGKTVSSIIAFMKFVRSAPPGNILIAGKTERTLKRNIIDPMIEMIGPARCRLVSGSGELWLLGRRVYLAGALDERAQEKIRGLSLVGAYGDEVSTWPESFWRMLLSRLSDHGARMFATTNPDAPGHWLKKDFLDRASVHLTHHGQVLRDDGPDTLDLARMSFRLPDNPYLPPDYVESLEREFTGLWRRRFIDGLWVVAAGAVYDMWDPDIHVIDIVPGITRWLCCAVDYGQANPFHALLIGLGADNVLYVVAEWRHDARRTQRQFTDVEYSEALRTWLDQVPHPATRQGDGSWLRGVTPEYMVVDPSAASFRVQLYRDGRNPVAANNAVLDGIRLVGSLLHAGKLKISRDCPALITELSGYSWDDSWAKRGEDKPVKQDDHGCLVAGTPVMTAAGWKPIETIRAGELVATRQGLKPVVAAGMTNPAAPTLRVTLTGGRVLEGTADHPVWVAGSGWTRIDALRYGDIVGAWQTPRSSPIRESAFVGIPTRLTGPNARTTHPALPTASEAPGACTRKSGSTTTGRSRPAITSTTATTTRSTTTRPTWSASPAPTTLTTTDPAGANAAASQSSSPTWSPSAHWPPHGTAAPKGTPGTSSTARTPGPAGQPSQAPASSARSHTTPSPRTVTTASAPTPASRPGAEPAGSTTSTASATCAARPSRPTNTPRPSTAAVRVQHVAAGQQSAPVYNLTVADCPEFYAAGVLVHNCDALRYGIATTRQLWHQAIPLITTPRDTETVWGAA